MDDITVANILARLKSMTQDDGEMMNSSLDEYTRDIKHYLDQNWTENEIVSMLKLTEAVNPELEEDYALAQMRKVRNQINARLGGRSI